MLTSGVNTSEHADERGRNQSRVGAANHDAPWFVCWAEEIAEVEPQG
jgi:hypothetical protein